MKLALMLLTELEALDSSTRDEEPLVVNAIDWGRRYVLARRKVKRVG